MVESVIIVMFVGPREKLFVLVYSIEFVLFVFFMLV